MRLLEEWVATGAQLVNRLLQLRPAVHAFARRLFGKDLVAALCAQRTHLAVEALLGRGHSSVADFHLRRAPDFRSTGNADYYGGLELEALSFHQHSAPDASKATDAFVRQEQELGEGEDGGLE